MGIKLSKALKRFAKGESGAAIVEYGLALLVVGTIAVTGFSYLGTQTNNNVLGACETLGSATC